MSVRAGIEQKLRDAFAPETLEVVDESDRHKGHMGARPEGETHFRVRIVSDAFDGVGRIARQQKVHAVLAEELAGPVHALSLKIQTVAEAAS